MIPTRKLGSACGAETGDLDHEKAIHRESRPSCTSLALWRLIDREVTYPKPNPRAVTDGFLRTLSDPLFDHLLVLALCFFRRGARVVEDRQTWLPNSAL
jgi:hypothetical protein